MSSEDTIIAPITAPGMGAVTVLRISGPLTKTLVEGLAEKAEKALSLPRHLVLTAFWDRSSQQVSRPPLDEGLLVYFKGPESYTGEDCAEIHLHGSPYLLERFLLSAQALGARLAEPGEFTRRAYLNGRIDLLQAEAVADLIQAETEGQARVAREQLQGKLSNAVQELREPLEGLLVEIEAYIDFPEEDIEPAQAESWKASLEESCKNLKRQLRSFEHGRRIREGVRVCIAGLPNAGKSSLLNQIVGENRVIVTAEPGTTRDSIEERISLDGLCVRLFDTAGIEVEARVNELTEAETLGVERSWKLIRESDLVLFIADATEEFETASKLFERVREEARELLLVFNKADLVGKDPRGAAEPSSLELDSKPLVLSALTGAGCEELLQELRARVLPKQGAEGALITTERHRSALGTAQDSLERALQEIEASAPPELVSLSVREGLSALSDIVGVVTTEDVLGGIFSKFCIGK